MYLCNNYSKLNVGEANGYTRNGGIKHNYCSALFLAIIPKDLLPAS